MKQGETLVDGWILLDARTMVVMMNVSDSQVT